MRTLVTLDQGPQSSSLQPLFLCALSKSPAQPLTLSFSIPNPRVKPLLPCSPPGTCLSSPHLLVPPQPHLMLSHFPAPHPFPRPPPPPRVPFVSPYPTPTPPPRAQSLSAPPPSIFGPCRRRLPSGPGNLMPVTVGSCSRFGREKRQPGQERQVLAAPLSRWLCPAGSDRHACVGQTPKPRVGGGPSAGPASPQEGGGVRG